jgi:hypothetical protein
MRAFSALLRCCTGWAVLAAVQRAQQQELPRVLLAPMQLLAQQGVRLLTKNNQRKRRSKKMRTMAATTRAVAEAVAGAVFWAASLAENEASEVTLTVLYSMI